MTWDQFVQILTGGWPIAAVVIAFALRPTVRALAERLESLKVGDTAAAFARKAIDEREKQAALAEGEATKAAPPAPVGVSAEANLPPLAARADVAMKPPADPRWHRFWNFYCVAYNTVYSAFAVVVGNPDQARRELASAIHHAKQVPLATSQSKAFPPR
jgi:hypothetical protein